LLWKSLRNQWKKPRLEPGRRIYAVGDIHGRADLVADLFNRIDSDRNCRPTAQSDEIFLGDYIDRGPDSREVIELLIAREQRYRVLFLKGNHEDLAFRIFTDSSVLTEWQNLGGTSTLLSYGLKGIRYQDPFEVAAAFRNSMPDAHYRFLQRLSPSFSCGDFFFAHAGVRPGIPLLRQSEHDLLWIRDEFLLHEGWFGKVVVHGHSPVVRPDIRPNRINIDTGAYATGRLSCLVLENDDIRFL
jgi:serine/threonine protein phosphatase 1